MKNLTFKQKEEEKSRTPLSILNEIRKKLKKREKIINGKTSASTPIPKKPVNLNQGQYITIFEEIVRRMINSETSNMMISLQEKNLIDAVIYYEKLINTGKNSHGELIDFGLHSEFNLINDALIRLIVEIINFHCATLENITLDNNYIDSSALKILFSSLKLNSALFLREIHIWQSPNLSEDCIKIILEQLRANISIKVINRREIGIKLNEKLAWNSVDYALDYNIQFEIAKEALPILILLLSKDVVQSIVMDFVLGELSSSHRTDKPLDFDGKDDKFLKQMRTTKPGLKTLCMLEVAPKYLEQYTIAFIKRHHLTLQCIRFPSFNSAILFRLPLFEQNNFFLTEVDISEDKPLNIKQLHHILECLKRNSTLKKLTLTPNPNPFSEETHIQEQIEAELSYNEQLGIAHVALPIFIEIYKELNQESKSSSSAGSITIGGQILMVMMSFLLGDASYPQRLNKKISFNSSGLTIGLTIFGSNFRQSELLEAETMTRLEL